EPRLARMAAEAAPDSKARLHAGLALVATDPGQVDYLFERLLVATPEEVLVLRAGLAGHSRRLTGRLWDVLEGGQIGAGRRLQAACALAAYDPGNPRWAGVAPDVTNQLVAENSLLVGKWAEALRPVSGFLVGPLADVCRDARRPDSERVVAANLVADYAAERVD